MTNRDNYNQSSMLNHLEDVLLIAYLDGELPETDKNIAAKHLEDCWECRGNLKVIQDSIENFMGQKREVLSHTPPPAGNPEIKLFEKRLQNLKDFENSFRETSGREYQLEAEFTNGFHEQIYHSPEGSKQSVRNRISRLVRGVTGFFDRLRLKIAASGSAVGWRYVTVSGVLLLFFTGLVTWLTIFPGDGISASEILRESERQGGLWYRQPDKVLHWCWETTLLNHSGLPDGKYRSLFWLNNTGGKSLRLIRKYDQNGVLVWATWTQADGTDIVYNHFPKDEIKIFPGIDALRAYAAGLDEKKRQTVERYIDLTVKFREIEAEITTKQQALGYAFNNASVQIIQTPDIGKVFRINRPFGPNDGDKFSRGEVEYDIAADTFIKHRLKSVRYYPAGKIEVEDAKLEFYRESSVEEFNANDLTKEMGQIANIIKVTPEEILKNVTPETVLKMAEVIENKKN